MSHSCCGSRDSKKDLYCRVRSLIRTRMALAAAVARWVFSFVVMSIVRNINEKSPGKPRRRRVERCLGAMLLVPVAGFNHYFLKGWS